MKRRKQIFQGGIFLFCCLVLLIFSFRSAPARSRIARVRRVLVQKEKDKIKVTFVANRPLHYQVLQNPDSKPVLVFDLSPALLWQDKETRLIHEAGVQDLRIAQNSSKPDPDIVRIVFDLEKPVAFSVKSSPNHHQIFVSVTPTVQNSSVSSNVPTANAVNTSLISSNFPKTPNPSLSSEAVTPVIWNHVQVETKTLRPKTQTSEALLSPLQKIQDGKSRLQGFFVSRAAPIKKVRKKLKKYTPPPSEDVTINWRGANLPDVIRQLADRLHLNVIIDKAVTGTVTLDLKNVPAQQALSMIVSLNGYGMRQTGNILIVAPPEALAKVPVTPAALGPQSTQVIPLENAKAADVKDTIVKEFPGIQADVDARLNAVIIRGSAGVIRQVMELVSQLDESIQAAAPETAVFQLNYAKEKDVEIQLKTLLPPNAVLIADERLNTLIVSGSADAAKIAKSFIQTVDVPSPQVMLAMEVVSVEEKASRDLGVEWDAATSTNFTETSAGEPGGSLPSQAAITNTTSTTTSSSTATSTTQTPSITKNTLSLQKIGIHAFVRDNFGIKAILHWLVTQEKAKVLGSPRVAALNNKEATINLGQTLYIPYFDPRAGIYQAQPITVGVILKMTPAISSNGDIELHLEPTVSQVISFTQTTPPYPNIAQRTADTWVRVKNGQTIVIGGLLQDSSDEVITKIPLLGDIPLIGELFRHRTLSRDKTDLVITVTPTLIATR